MRATAPTLLASLALLSCRPANTVQPDFRLQDVNPGSATYGQQVSPRDFEGRASGWYFTHTT